MKVPAVKVGLALAILSNVCYGAALDALDFNGRLETRQALTREGEWGQIGRAHV